jgi:excinuclease UvrABC ATPase subunit
MADNNLDDCTHVAPKGEFESQTIGCGKEFKDERYFFKQNRICGMLGDLCSDCQAKTNQSPQNTNTTIPNSTWKLEEGESEFSKRESSGNDKQRVEVETGSEDISLSDKIKEYEKKIRNNALFHHARKSIQSELIGYLKGRLDELKSELKTWKMIKQAFESIGHIKKLTFIFTIIDQITADIKLIEDKLLEIKNG